MIKIISFLLISSVYLSAVSYWTLSGLTKVNVYVNNKVSLLKPETIELIKDKMYKTLQDEGVQTKQQDSPILIIAFSEIENDDMHYVHIRLSLGEDVQTFRVDKSATFALTYDESDFIEADKNALDKAILESADALVANFKAQFKEDKEE